MLTKADEKYHADCSRKFISDGFAIASHTITHRLLPMLLPNEAFYEILAQRIKLESALDVPVVAFALPGYVATHPFYEDAPPPYRRLHCAFGIPSSGGALERQR